MGPSSRPGHTHTLPRRGTQILPKAYEKSERLALEFWDPRRLASHVLATLSPEEQRAPAVNLILEMKITCGFLSHYTYQIEELLPDGDCELIRAIARTIPKTFWIPLREPRAYDKYSLREIVNDLECGASHVEEDYVVPSVEESAAPCCQWVYEEEGEEAEAEAEAEEAEEDTSLPEPLAGEDAALVNNDHKVELGEYQDDDETGRGGSSRGPEGERGYPGLAMAMWTATAMVMVLVSYARYGHKYRSPYAWVLDALPPAYSGTWVQTFRRTLATMTKGNTVTRVLRWFPCPGLHAPAFLRLE